MLKNQRSRVPKHWFFPLPNPQTKWAIMSLGILRLNIISTKPQTEWNKCTLMTVFSSSLTPVNNLLYSTPEVVQAKLPHIIYKG